jgi:hypothetical protein
MWFHDRPPVPNGTEPVAGALSVSPAYFEALKIPLLRGRWFSNADRQNAPKVVLISEAAARKFWPGEDPIGKPVGIGENGFSDSVEVVGVVGDVCYGQMDGSAAARSVYLVFASAAQQPGGVCPHRRKPAGHHRCRPQAGPGVQPECADLRRQNHG